MKSQSRKQLLFYAGLFLLSLLWLLPLCSSLNMVTHSFWDPATHFANISSSLAGGDTSFLSAKNNWLSEVCCKGWLAICPWNAIRYWWFFFGGAVLSSLVVVTWLAATRRAMGLQEDSKWWWALAALAPPVHVFLLVHYVTVPMFLAGGIFLVLSRLGEKRLSLLAVLGVLNSLLVASRLNLVLMVPVCFCVILAAYWKERHFLFRGLLCWIGAMLATTLLLEPIRLALTSPVPISGTTVLVSSNSFYKDFSIILGHYRSFLKEAVPKGLLIGLLLSAVLMGYRRLCHRLQEKWLWFWPMLLGLVICVLFCFRMQPTMVLRSYRRILEGLLFTALILLVHAHFAHLLQWKKASFVERVRLVCAVLFPMAFIAALPAGSKIPNLLLMECAALISIAFVGALAWWRQDDALLARFCHALMFAFLLIGVTAGIKTNYKKPLWQQAHFHENGLRWCSTDSVRARDELERAVRVTRQHIAPGDVCFEAVSNWQSILPFATTIAGGRNAFPFWKPLTQRHLDDVQHILVWKNTSAQFWDSRLNYLFDMYEIQNSLLENGNFHLVADDPVFALYSRTKAQP